MTANGWLQILVYSARDPGGDQAARHLHVPRLRGRPAAAAARLRTDRALPLPAAAASIRAREQNWKEYTLALLLFSAFGVLVTYAIQRLQDVLPFNPQGFGAVSADSSFNTAASFTTNTNWQAYGGRVDDELPHARWRGSPGTTSPRPPPASRVALALARGLTRAPAAGRRRGRSATSGSTSSARILYVLLPHLHRLRAGAGLAGRHPELRAVPSR